MAYNNKKLKIIGILPYYANYRKHLNLFKRTLLTTINVEKAMATAKELQKTHDLIKESIFKI